MLKKEMFPGWVHSLAAEVDWLGGVVVLAYEYDPGRATKLDAEYATKLEVLETAIHELQTGQTDEDGDWGAGALEGSLVEVYVQFVEKRPFPFAMDGTISGMIDQLRSVARSYGWTLGGFIEETTDEMLLEAAREAFSRKMAMRSRRLDEDRSTMDG